MTLADVYSMLNGMTGFNGKVVYNAWEVGNAPELPFICYLETQTNNFKADNQVYKKIQDIDIELYTKTKDTVSEDTIEETLNRNHIAWDKTEDYIESEKCFEIVYSISI